MDSRQTQPELKVYSLDFDGMLTSPQYFTEFKAMVKEAADQNRGLTKDDYTKLANTIIETRKDFFDREFSDKESKHVVFVGSDRQDRAKDRENGIQNGTLSSYPVYEALVEQLQERYKTDIELNKFLLEDAYLGLPPGTVFENEKQACLQQGPATIKTLNRVFDENNMEFRKDRNEVFGAVEKKALELEQQKNIPPSVKVNYRIESKFTLMYGQMHYAQEHYNKYHIQYNFLDDRKDILEHASKLYSENPSFIPPDMIMRFGQLANIEQKNIELATPERFEKNKFGEFEPVAVHADKNSQKQDYSYQLRNFHVNAVNRYNQTMIDPDVTYCVTEMNRLKQQITALEIIKVKLNSREDSAGIKEMKKTIDHPDLSPEAKLVSIVRIAEDRTKSVRMSAREMFGIKPRKDENVELYAVLKTMNPANPEIDNLKNISEPKPQSPKLNHPASPSLRSSSRSSSSSNQGSPESPRTTAKAVLKASYGGSNLRNLTNDPVPSTLSPIRPTDNKKSTLEAIRVGLASVAQTSHVESMIRIIDDKDLKPAQMIMMLRSMATARMKYEQFTNNEPQVANPPTPLDHKTKELYTLISNVDPKDPRPETIAAIDDFNSGKSAEVKGPGLNTH